MFTGASSDYFQQTGNHVFRTAASVSAGSNVSLTEIMRIQSDGDFQLQTANQASAMQTDHSGDDIIFGSSSAGNSNAYFGNLHSADTFFYVANNSSTTSTPPLFVNRQNNDGSLIVFRQGDSDEGSI